jgi:hypothetical protein
VVQKKGGKMNFSYEELETDLLNMVKELHPDFRDEWMPYPMLDLLEDGVFGTEEDEQE